MSYRGKRLFGLLLFLFIFSSNAWAENVMSNGILGTFHMKENLMGRRHCLYQTAGLNFLTSIIKTDTRFINDDFEYALRESLGLDATWTMPLPVVAFGYEFNSASKLKVRLAAYGVYTLGFMNDPVQPLAGATLAYAF